MKRVLLLAAAIITGVILSLTACSSTPAASQSAPSATAPATASSAPIPTKPQEGQGTFTGYLIDQKCGLQGIDIQDGTDITKFPEKHTLSCALMPMCIASGYGISIQQSDGTYKYYKFDANGSTAAKSTVIDKTTKKDSLLVEVTGAMNGDTITLVSIKEIDTASVTPNTK